MNILVAWREKNLQIKQALADFDPSSVAQSMTRKPTPTDLGDLLSLSVDDLWLLREQIGILLTRKISDHLYALGKRLEQLRAEDHSSARVCGEDSICVSRTRRPYPPVLPKYQNSSNPSQTWSGRGKQPRWLITQLIQGKHLDDFRIATDFASQRKPVPSDEMANCH